MENKQFFNIVHELRTLVSDNHYDVVHVHTPIAGLIVRFALRNLRSRKKVKVIYTAHGFHFCETNGWLKNFIYRSIERVAGRWLDAIITINEDDYRACTEQLRIPLAKVYKFPGVGIATDCYPRAVASVQERELLVSLDIERFKFRLIMVAEFNPGKRHIDAIDALTRLNNPSVVLMCAGVGPLMEQVKQYAYDKGVSGQVRFLGFRSDIPELLAISDLAVFPSIREGLPRFVMEAMASGVPVVGYNIRGVRDLLSAGVGVLCDPYDVQGLAEGVESLLESEEQRAKLAAKGLERIRDYDVSLVIKAHDELYNELLEKA
ncbi:MAG: glycosyltransferase [Motiliproteus sp.]